MLLCVIFGLAFHGTLQGVIWHKAFDGGKTAALVCAACLPSIILLAGVAFSDGPLSTYRWDLIGLCAVSAGLLSGAATYLATSKFQS